MHFHSPLFLLLFSSLWTIALSAQGVSSIRPVRLTCTHQENPLGIDVPFPVLGWGFESAERNQVQTAYEILVGEKESEVLEGHGSAWETGKVISDQNVQVVYQGRPLKSFTRYYWRVRVYDAPGRVSDWSPAAWFETAMLEASDWRGRWIGDGRLQFTRDSDFYRDDPMPLIRKQFVIRKKIASARLYISGLGYYEAYINEQKIGDHVLDPGFTNYDKQVFYVTYDLTSMLLPGEQTLGIMLGNGWYNPLPLRLFGRFNLRDVQQTGRPCVRAQLLLRYADGSADTLGTDDTWQTAAGPILRNSVYLGECYDARLEKSFHSKKGWKNAVPADGPGGRLTAQAVPPIRVTRVIRPISIREVGKDTFLVDMGQNMAGVARIRVHGPAGTAISIRYGEDTLSNGTLNYLTTVAGQIKEIWKVDGGPGAPRTAWQTDRYILKGNGPETWLPRFTFHGFRYLEITGWPGKPTPEAVEGLLMHSDLQVNGDFSCSNELFNRLHQVVLRTFLSNVFSVQSDCPGREKMGYGADMVATAEAFAYNFDMSDFYRKTVQDFANDQQTDGGITETAPFTGIADRGYGGRSGPLGWQLAFPYLQKLLFDQYGDTLILAQQYEAFKKQMDFLQARSIDGLYHWDIGDHEALDPRPEAFTASAFYYHHALLAGEFAGILGKKEDAEKYVSLARGIKEAIVRKYWIPGTGRFDNATQSAQIFAMWYRLLPGHEEPYDVFLQELARHGGHLSTGIFSTKMLFDLLTERGDGDLACKIVDQTGFPGWGYMLSRGATTLWETWAYPDNAPSQNHPMFGSVDAWFYKSLLGIRAAAPGFKKIVIKPQPATLTFARGYYHSVHGKIAVDWKKGDDGFNLYVEIPVNTSAEIWLPAVEGIPVTENGRPLSQVPEVHFLRFEQGYAVFSTGSGAFRFHSGLK
jgi:alpha-L-rhamnosidase